MTRGKQREDVTLIDVLIDGFEKNEILGGFHWRDLPMPDESSAARKFAALTAQAQRLQGPPTRLEERDGRRVAAWSDLEIRQAGRGVMVRARAPWFSNWWHDAETWKGNPMGPIFAWLREEGD
jgi:hypothetical protein